MNDLFKTLTELLKNTGSGSKAIAVLVGAAVLVAVGVTATVSNQTHYELTFSGLSDHEVAKVNKALSDAGLAFETSQPPGPFVVYLDRSDRSAAFNAVYGAGALDKPLKGILTNSGIESVFQGSEERQQSVRKREWQEMEGMLEVLDFVVSARVRTSPGKISPLASTKTPLATASVTLRLSIEQLAPAQAQTVATLVSRGLGIAEQNLVISDQDGNSLFDGRSPTELDLNVKGTLAHRLEHDRSTSEEINALLAEILGPNKARVTVRSEWNWDRSTTHIETPAGKGALVSEMTNSSETPILGSGAGGIGGAAGSAANLAVEGEANETTRAAAETQPPLISKKNELTRQYQPTVTTEDRVRFAPEIKRLSIAVYLDDSIDSELISSLEQTIKTTVGYSEGRDIFHSVHVPFILDEADLEAEAASEAEGTPADSLLAEPNPLVEQLLGRGVEIVSALVFIGLLFKSLKSGSKKGATVIPAEPRGKEARADTSSIDPELLARVQIEELLKEDPERVGEILSSWALAEEASGAKV